MSKKKEEEQRQADFDEQIRRIKLPRGNQCLGIIERRLGSSRMSVKCLDGKKRICRIPGRMKRYLWVREGDVVIIEPWEFGGDAKGDVIFKYNKSQLYFLKNKGYLKQAEATETF